MSIKYNITGQFSTITNDLYLASYLASEASELSGVTGGDKQEASGK